MEFTKEEIEIIEDSLMAFRNGAMELLNNSSHFISIPARKEILKDVETKAALLEKIRLCKK